MPDLDPVPRYVAFTSEAQENREAHERLEAEQAREVYMEELRRHYL
jgi:hypothetical protein